MVFFNSFLFYDIIFLVIFTLFVVWFLYTRKSNLKREGIIYLYRTKLGIKFINYVGNKYKRTINVLQYFSIINGFILMVSIILLLIFTIYTYIKFPQITQVVKAPPLLPLIPYFPSIFGLESFFPPLYFIYWIIAILIVAAVHEFSHGIFAKFHRLKIKSTGFAFLGPILGAFVEPDEKQMVKKKNFAQMAILSSGVFANIVTAAIFFIIMWGTFSFAFNPAGVFIHSYPQGLVEISAIKTIDGISFNGNFDGFLNEEKSELINIKTDQGSYLIPQEALKNQLSIIGENLDKSGLNVYLDAPAIKNGLVGAISKVDEFEIRSMEDLTLILESKSPGETIHIETITRSGKKNYYEIILDNHPLEKEKAFLGINLNINNLSGFRKTISNVFFFKNPSIFYEESNKTLVFIYYLLWWVVMINFFVALFNMLPVGILDGGRFFYLTIFSITKSEKSAKNVYKIFNYLILFIFLALLFSWLFAL